MKKIFILFLGLTIFFGCDSYLDEVPDNRQDVKSLEDVEELLVSAYSDAIYNYVEWKSDNATFIIQNTQYPWMTENFSYQPVVSEEDQDTPSYLWEKNYQSIAHANQALEELSNIEEGDVDYKNSLMAEGLITRAYNHFMLASVFCLDYQTNKSALGIPYITAPETQLEVVYERGTLEETYNLIEKDLLEALPLVSNDNYVGTGKYHFNKNAAYAFASRFYLFKGDYAKCIEYSNKMLGEGLVEVTYIRNMEEVFTGSGSVAIANNFIDVSHPANLLVVRKESSTVTRYTRRGYQANTEIFTEIFQLNNPQGSNDQRNLAYGSSSSSARAQPKFTELFKYTTSTTGSPYYIMTELRGEEVVLNRIESYIRENRLDEAIADYNVMASLRYDHGGQLDLATVTSYYGGTQQEAMLDLVISERRKEFLREGLRWFDIKRLGLEVYHVIEANTFGTVLKDVTLSAQDLRKAEQIPLKAIINGIKENPGY